MNSFAMGRNGRVRFQSTYLRDFFLTYMDRRET